MALKTQDNDLMARAAWLSFVGDLSQKQIAHRLGISRVKVNRLITRAIASNLVRFSVESAPVECVALENELIAEFGLGSCYVVPTVGDEILPLASLANAGAFVLQKEISNQRHKIIGVGHGRTLEATVEALPHEPHKHLRFVALLGCLSRVGAADPFDVVHHLSKITEAECYYLPAPLFAESEKDKKMLMQQKPARGIVELGMAADFCVVGIGDMGEKSYLFNTLTEEERAAMLKEGAVGDIIGCFINGNGEPVECDINRCAITVGLAALLDKRVLAIAGGRDKETAIVAALRSGVVTDLVIDENTAAKAVEIMRPAQMRRRA